MPFRVAIIGAGWYGCHLASSLLALGMQVQLFEQHSRPLHLASGNNQFRLHLGFHYARHHGTRIQSRDGFIRFLERYPKLSAEVTENVYAVPRHRSLIDFATYKLIMVSSGIDFVEMHGGHPMLADVEGIIKTQERVLLTERARAYFLERLAPVMTLGQKVEDVRESEKEVRVHGQAFDYLIDATWGHRGGIPIDVIYEPTLLLYYEARVPLPAITFVDGPLSSIYPTEDPKVFTLSSVPHTPLGVFGTPSEAVACRDGVSAIEVQSKRIAMEEQIRSNVPAFHDMLSFAGAQLSIKTKPVGKCDDRSCYVYRRGRTFTVLSGKIDTVFYATERVLSMIEADHSDAPRSLGAPTTAQFPTPHELKR